MTYTQQAEKNLRSVAVTMSKDGKTMNFGEGFFREKSLGSLSYSNWITWLTMPSISCLKIFSGKPLPMTAVLLCLEQQIQKLEHESRRMQSPILCIKKNRKSWFNRGRHQRRDYLMVTSRSGCIFSVLLANPDMVRFINQCKDTASTV